MGNMLRTGKATLLRDLSEDMVLSADCLGDGGKVCCYFSYFHKSPDGASMHFSSSINFVHEIAHCSYNGAYGYICVGYDFPYFHYVWACGYVCKCVTHEGAEGSALICCIFPLLTERKNIHMIDVFVVLPFARENSKRWKNRYRCRRSERSRD